MATDLVLLIGLTLLPFLELRASIPYGILVLKLHWLNVFIICVLTNAILGPVIFFLLDKVVHLFLRIKQIEVVWIRLISKTQRKIRPYVDRYGEMGVALFIGIPMPGSGSYSGALGSYLLGLRYRKFTVANSIGVLIAGVLVTIIVLSGNTAWNLFVKTV